MIFSPPLNEPLFPVAIAQDVWDKPYTLNELLAVLFVSVTWNVTPPFDTWNVELGLAVPIPTLPAVVTNKPAAPEELSPQRDKPELPTKPEVALIYPVTSSFWVGVVVPIPTTPPNEAVEAFCVIEPVNTAGPMFVNVDEPETVSEPEISTLPDTSRVALAEPLPIEVRPPADT